MENSITEIYKAEPKFRIKLASQPYDGTTGPTFQIGPIDTTKSVDTGMSFTDRWKSAFTSLFLPKGYPDTVSPDYLTYQIWDSAQAFCSSICGALATQSVMTGLGVGDSAATPLGATINWVLRSGAGMVGGIAFAYRAGDRLDADLKQWRLLADVLNDAALSLELAAPWVATACPSSPYALVVLFSVASVAKACVGVAGGATRAALIHHQARANNSADVAAKDGSQETLVNLVALLVVVFILPFVSGRGSLFTYAVFGVLVALHLAANYKAVRAIRCTRVNGHRYHSLVNAYLCHLTNGPTKDQVDHYDSGMTPDRVNESENVWLFNRTSDTLLEIELGARVSEVLSLLSITTHEVPLVTGESYYLLAPYRLSPPKSMVSPTCPMSLMCQLISQPPKVEAAYYGFKIALRSTATPKDELRAIFQAECFSHLARKGGLSINCPSTRRLKSGDNGLRPVFEADGPSVDKSGDGMEIRSRKYAKETTCPQREKIQCSGEKSLVGIHELGLLGESLKLCDILFPKFYQICTEKYGWDFTSTMFVKEEWRYE